MAEEDILRAIIIDQAKTILELKKEIKMLNLFGEWDEKKIEDLNKELQQLKGPELAIGLTE